MYTSKMTADQWLQQVSLFSNQIVNATETGKILWDKFNAMTYNMTDAQILALPQLSGWTQQNLTDVKYALSSLKEMNDVLNNIAIATANRYGYLEPFLLG
jgi:hypothetical protein